MKEKNISQNQEDTTNYYDLKTDAVNDLIKALNEEPKEETPSVHKKYISNNDKPDPYKIDKLAMIPTWIKAFFIKFWVAGAICYFFLWGIGNIDILDKLFIAAIATGIIMDLLVNPAMLYFESEKKEYNPYILVPVPAKKIWSLLINIPISFIQIGIIFWIYTTINSIIINIKHLPSNSVPLTVEPLLFGLFYLIIDMICVVIKNLIIKIYKKIINKNK